MKKGKLSSIVFVGLSMVCCLLPFLGMAVAPTTETTENKKLAELPVLVDEKGFHADYLSGLGAYFTDHFAFRRELVTADALLSGKVFGVSNVDTVLVGKDDWLYYTDTLDDYLGRNLLSARGIFNAANNIRQMQRYVEDTGKTFLLMVAPNKNTLYGEHMPWQQAQRESTVTNIGRLQPKLEEMGVHYLDLFRLFKEQDEVLYFKRDSHWNNQGAMLVYEAMRDRLQLPSSEAWESAESEVREDYIGDLNAMLYPLASRPEENVYYDRETEYTYVTPTKSVEDAWIQTEAPQGSGTLLMYRDSFGNSLLPLAANDFAGGWFSKMIPYNLQMHLEQYAPEYVVVEKVERNLSEFAADPPILQGRRTEAPENPEPQEDAATLEVSEPEANLTYWQFSGELDPKVVGEESRVILRILDNGAKADYEAFTTCSKQSDNGYRLYLKKDSLGSAQLTVQVIVTDGENSRRVLTQEVDLTQVPTQEG